MLSNQAEPLQQASLAAGAETGAAEAPAPAVNPRGIIEVASDPQNPPPNDQIGTEKPPGVAGLDYLAG
jgi:hypothetical protein